MGVAFDWTVKFGDVLVIGGCLFTAGSFLFRKGGDYKGLQMAVTAALEEISELKKEVKDMSQVLVRLAVQDERIAMLTRWYDELRRGQGFVKGPQGIDREY